MCNYKLSCNLSQICIEIHKFHTLVKAASDWNYICTMSLKNMEKLIFIHTVVVLHPFTNILILCVYVSKAA